MNNDDNIVGALARGMLAGVAGAIAMTLSERLEMAVTGREGSSVPGKVAAHLVPGANPGNTADVQRLNAPMHWAHGIGMGAVRGLLDAGGVRSSAATAAHFAVLWSGDAMLYRSLGVAEAPWRWSADELATDVLHKGVYAAVTGAVYAALTDVADSTEAPQTAS